MSFLLKIDWEQIDLFLDFFLFHKNMAAKMECQALQQIAELEFGGIVSVHTVAPSSSTVCFSLDFPVATVVVKLLLLREYHFKQHTESL